MNGHKLVLMGLFLKITLNFNTMSAPFKTYECEGCGSTDMELHYCMQCAGEMDALRCKEYGVCYICSLESAK